MAIMSRAFRQANRAVIPPALRAITSSKIPFSSSSVMAKQGFPKPIHFSPATTYDELKRVDQKLINAITKSQFKSSKPFDYYNIQKPEEPQYFYYEIEDNINESVIRLKKRLDGWEKTIVEVHEPIYPQNWRNKIDKEKEKEKEGFSFNKPHFKLTMSYTRRSFRGVSDEEEKYINLTINLWANVGHVGSLELFMDSERLPNEVSLGKEEYWRDFLKERHIDDSTMAYIMNYMTWRSARKYLLFWEKATDFLNE